MRQVPFDGWVKRNEAELTYPRAAAGLSVAAGGTWGWSAYSQIVGSTTEDFIPTWLNLSVKAAIPVAGAGALQNPVIEYEVATGPAGTEVPFARHTEGVWAILQNPGTATNGLLAWSRSVPVGPTLIPQGKRIAHRARQSVAGSTAQTTIITYIMGYDKNTPVMYSPYSYRGHLAGIHKPMSQTEPSGAVVAVGTAWTQVIGTTARDLLIWGASRDISSVTAASAIVSLGVGAAGSEVQQATIAFPGVLLGNSNGIMSLRNPILIKKGERFAAKIATGATSNFMFLYESVPA